MRKHHARLAAAVLLAATAPTVSANDLYWLGGTGPLGGNNYFDLTTATTPDTPDATDNVFIGAAGTADSAVDLTLGRLRVGHNTNATGAPVTTAGTGTVNVTAGTLTLSIGGTGGNASIIVGNIQSGTLNIDNATVSAFQLVQVGYGNNVNRTGILNITNNGRLDVSAGNLNLGEGNNATAAGLPGQVNVNGTLNVNGSGADLNIGQRSGASSFTQTAGATSIADQTNVGRVNADGTSFNLSGGTFFTGGVFSAATGSVDDGYTDDVSVNITGGTLTTGRGLVIATGAARNTTLNVSNDAVVTITNNLAIADHNGTADNTIFNLSGTAQMSVGIDAFIGRGNSTNTTFNMTGGSLSVVGNYVAADSGNGTFTAGVVTNHSAGPITTGGHFVLATTQGDATHNLSGNGSITTTGMVVVGRQEGTGIMNQTGGTVTANAGVGVGYQVAVTGGLAPDAALNATGTYNISGGTLVATAASPADALSVAAQGTGTFRVIGDDATVTVNGNLAVYTNTFGTHTGTLAYRLEAGDTGLSTVAATGTATFNAGSVLQLDFNAVKPVQGVYNALTAADIINNGLVASIPAGWNYQIVPSTGGETLRFIAGDLNSNGTIDRDDFALIDRGRAMNLTGGANGDLNADGTIDSDDYALIDQAFGTTNTLSPGFLAARASEFGDAYVAQLVAAVPEPTSLTACGLALPALLRRRRIG